MPFMVIYRTSDGVTRYEQSSAIDEAALFVERLRNKDSIDQVRIYRMEEIDFAFRPYYKVELGAPDRSGQHGSPALPVGLTDQAFAAEGPAGDLAAGLEPPEEPEVAAAVEIPPPPPPPAPLVEPAGTTGNGNGSARSGLFGR